MFNHVSRQTVSTVLLFSYSDSILTQTLLRLYSDSTLTLLRRRLYSYSDSHLCAISILH